MTEIHRYFQLKVRLLTTLSEERSASQRISNYFQQGLFVWISNYSQQGAFIVAKDFKLNSARLVCLKQRNAGHAASSVILWRSFRMEHNELFKCQNRKTNSMTKLSYHERCSKLVSQQIYRPFSYPGKSDMRVLRRSSLTGFS